MTIWKEEFLILFPSIYISTWARTGLITLHDNPRCGAMVSRLRLPVNIICPPQPDLHLQSTELYLRLDWPPPHLQTENGCISQHCHHPHHLPSRAGRQHLSARHDHHLPGGSPGPHSHQWPGKLASVIQRVFLFYVWQWIHLGLVMANVGPEKHPEQYYVHRWTNRKIYWEKSTLFAAF